MKHSCHCHWHSLCACATRNQIHSFCNHTLIPSNDLPVWPFFSLSFSLSLSTLSQAPRPMKRMKFSSLSLSLSPSTDAQLHARILPSFSFKLHAPSSCLMAYLYKLMMRKQCLSLFPLRKFTSPLFTFPGLINVQDTHTHKTQHTPRAGVLVT